MSLDADWRKRGFIRNPFRQRLLIVVVILIVFWDGLFAGMPRADQVQFLYQLASAGPENDNWLDFMSWNRVIAKGDEALYRPVLYALLVVCYRLFGYNFVLWQMASLALHALAVLGLHALLLRGSLRETALPFLLALLFAVTLLGSELVLWHHIMGYVLFCVLAVFSLMQVLQYLEYGRARDIWIAVLLGLLAEFTYELGAAFNLLIGIALLVYRYRQVGRDPVRRAVVFGTVPAFRHGVMFVTIAMAYPVFSFLDLALRGLSLPAGEPFSVVKLFLSLDYALRQLAFWLEAALFPTTLAVAPISRMVVKSISFGWATLQIINYVVVATLVVGTLVSLRDWRKRNSAAGLFRACAATLPALLFIFAYSWVIAYGRAVPRGIGYVLYGNVHYSYVAYLAMLVGIALFTWSIEQTIIIRFPIHDREGAVSAGSTAASPVSNWRGVLLSVSIGGLLILSAGATISIGNRLRYEFALPRDLLHYRARLWMERYGEAKDTYFVLAKCEFRGEAYWERTPGSGVYTKIPPNDVHRRADSVTFVDLLYPRLSYVLQKSHLAGRAVTIRDVCDDALIGRAGAP